MPVITKFEPHKTQTVKRQPTEVIASYKVDSKDGHGPLLQIDTYGSDARQFEGKLSQTIQLDSESARQLWEILGKAFRFT